MSYKSKAKSDRHEFMGMLFKGYKDDLRFPGH
jgi:hypothetical protein